MTSSPHLYAERFIRLIVLLDPSYGVRREPARRCDDQYIYARRLPELHLFAEHHYFRHVQTRTLPVLARDNRPMADGAGKLVLLYAVYRQVTPLVRRGCVG